ncbi:MAG: nicotinamide riboside transporter PnuC [Pseudomonadota bacterium]
MFQLLEAIAVVLAIAYLLLAARENSWCWVCAFISTAIYIGLFYSVALLSESLLNIFYLVMAVYGWWQWRGGGGVERREIHRWSWRRHVAVILGTALCVPLLARLTSAAGAEYAYLDAATTCYAVVTTFMVTRKVLENWLYWLVVDSVSIYLYLAKGLTMTAGLFALYLGICVAGFFSWRRAMVRDSKAALVAPT